MRAAPATTASPAGRRCASSSRTWATRSRRLRRVRNGLRALRGEGAGRARSVRRRAARFVPILRRVELQRQKHLVLILAREFASNLSTPTLITDADGNLVFYNEAAESVLGRRFSEVDETALDDWLAGFEPRTLDSEPLAPDQRPGRVALDQRRPSHLRYLVTSADGVEREIEVTAFPLFAHTDEFVGVVVIFWRD